MALVLFILPVQLVYDRFTTADDWTLFQVFVLRLVRFSFGNLSATVGRVFFSESVSFPFAQLRTRGTARKWTTKVCYLREVRDLTDRFRSKVSVGMDM